MDNNKQDKFHLKNLDPLRAIAAISVILGHTEQVKFSENLPNFAYIPFFTETSGRLGVILFFVLSGFLITILLLREKEKNTQINIKNFYIRRFLRILPLYYLILFIGIFIIKYDYSNLSLYLCLLLMPNIAHASSNHWGASPQIWSIGVEEQFYLIWPVFIYYMKKNILKNMLVIYFIVTFIPYFFVFLLLKTYPDTYFTDFMHRFVYGAKFSCIMMGCIVAYLYQSNNKILKYLYSKKVYLMSLFLSAFLCLIGFKLRYFNDEFYSIIFSIMILNLSTNKEIKINLESKLLNYLGKISYGLYMYHWIIIVNLISLLKPISYNIYLFNILSYLVTVPIIIVLSGISYKYFESPFLNMKKRFSSN
jgi:peptidoglycan/LPS O-acetylase OafA/YrhL